MSALTFALRFLLGVKEEELCNVCIIRFEGVELLDSLMEIIFGVGDPRVSVKAFLKNLNTDACFMTINRDARSLTTGQEMSNNAWALDLNPR